MAFPQAAVDPDGSGNRLVSLPQRVPVHPQVVRLAGDAPPVPCGFPLDEHHHPHGDALPAGVDGHGLLHLAHGQTARVPELLALRLVVHVRPDDEGQYRALSRICPGVPAGVPVRQKTAPEAVRGIGGGGALLYHPLDHPELHAVPRLCAPHLRRGQPHSAGHVPGRGLPGG